MPVISVLVPIYNAERYLCECLDSLVAQTFSDFEAILINDGSRDGSRAIMQHYADTDARFRVIDKPNSGYGASMNQGLDAVRGTFVAILESDDFYDAHALEVLHRALVGGDAQVAKANFWLYWSTPGVRREPFCAVPAAWAGRTCRPSTDCIDAFYQKPSIWSALYRTDFLRGAGIRFLETPGASYQDASFAFKVWALAERATFLDERVLYYRQDNEASSVNDPGKLYCVCDEYAEMRRFLAGHRELEAALEAPLVRMKFDSYMWNAKRLAPALRQEFLGRARDELAQDARAGLADEAVLGWYKHTDLRYLLDDPQAFLDAFESYGADTYARILAHYAQLGGLGLVASLVARKMGRR